MPLNLIPELFFRAVNIFQHERETCSNIIWNYVILPLYRRRTISFIISLLSLWWMGIPDIIFLTWEINIYAVSVKLSTLSIFFFISVSSWPDGQIFFFHYYFFLKNFFMREMPVFLQGLQTCLNLPFFFPHIFY